MFLRQCAVITGQMSVDIDHNVHLFTTVAKKNAALSYLVYDVKSGQIWIWSDSIDPAKFVYICACTVHMSRASHRVWGCFSIPTLVEFHQLWQARVSTKQRVLICCGIKKVWNCCCILQLVVYSVCQIDHHVQRLANNFICNGRKNGWKPHNGRVKGYITVVMEDKEKTGEQWSGEKEVDVSAATCWRTTDNWRRWIAQTLKTLNAVFVIEKHMSCWFWANAVILWLCLM